MRTGHDKDCSYGMEDPLCGCIKPCTCGWFKHCEDVTAKAQAYFDARYCAASAWSQGWTTPAANFDYYHQQALAEKAAFNALFAAVREDVKHGC